MDPRFSVLPGFRRTVLLLACLCGLLSPLGAAPIQQVEDESTLINVVLLALIKRITWPQDDKMGTGAYRICIVGAPALAELMRPAVAGMKVSGRSVLVEEMSSDSIAPEFGLVFLGESSPERQLAVIRQCAGRPVLLVSTSAGFAGRGGAIELQSVKVPGVRDRKRLVHVLNNAAFKVQKLSPMKTVWENAASILPGPAVEPQTKTAEPAPATVAPANGKEARP